MFTKIKSLIDKNKRLSIFFIVTLSLIIVLGLMNFLVRNPYFLYQVGAYDKGVTVSNDKYAAMPSVSSSNASSSQPVIKSFSASKYSINTGSSTTLTWSVYYANKVTINQGVGTVNKRQGSVNVSPTTTTTYTLMAQNRYGAMVTSQVVIEVLSVKPPLPTASFTANPLSITQGSFSTLSWTTTDASSVVIDQNIGDVYPISSIVVSPVSTTTYTLTVTNSTGSITKSVTITVTPLPAPTATFSANPTSVIQGSSSTLSWSTTNATTVTLDGVSVAASGTKSVTPTSTTTYTLYVKGSGGEVTKTTTVTVSPPVVVPTINSFTSSPTSITSGSSATLSWNISDATSASINQNVGTVSATSGTKSVSPTATTTYTLTATNSNGSKTANVTVTVSGTTTKTVSVADFNAKVNDNVDDSAQTQSALNSLGTGGGTVIFPAGTYNVGTSIRLPANNTDTMKLSGYGAMIKLTSYNTGFLKWAGTSGGVTYRKFYFEGFNVDNQNLGSGHSNYAAFGMRGSIQGDSFENITIKDCTVVNVPNTTLAHAYVFDIQAGGTSHVRDILIQGCKGYGGIAGFAVWAYNGTNVEMDRIYIRDCYHDTMYNVTTFDIQENYHLAQGAHLGTAEITNSIGKNSGDVGIEVDNAQNLLVRDCTIYNPWNSGYYLTNFYPPLGSGPGTVILEGNSTVLDRNYARGFGLVIEEGGDPYPYTPLGTYIWRNGTFNVLSPYTGVNNHAAFDTWGPSVNVQGLTIDGYKITDTTATSNSVLFNTSKVNGPMTISNVTRNGTLIAGSSTGARLADNYFGIGDLFSEIESGYNRVINFFASIIEKIF